MSRRSLVQMTLAVAVIALLPACAGNPGADRSATAAPAAPAAAAAPAAPAAPAAAANQQASTQSGTDASADEVVCKKYTVTGSRIASRKVCKTRREWVEDSRAIGDAMRAAERRGAAGAPPPSMGGG